VRPLLQGAAFAGAALGLGLELGSGCAAHGGATPGFEAPDAGVDSSAPVDAGQFSPSTDAAGSFGAGCATARAPIQRDPIYMLFVLDGSGSMQEDFKWKAAVPALSAFIDDLAARKDSAFGLGLTVFSDTLDKTGGAGPYDAIDVPIAYVDDAHAAALKARVAFALPRGQTPTYAVMSGQYALLEKYTPTAPLQTEHGHKVLVLMTDGVPTPDAGAQQPQCIQAAKDELARAAPGGPITTVAVGIGYTFPLDQQVYDPLFMAQLALAGGAPNQPCSPDETHFADNMCHLQITPIPNSDVTELELAMATAFEKIRAKVISCELVLDKSGIVDPSLVNVVFTDAVGTEHVVPEDPTNGWTYDDPTTPTKVVLHGQSCQDLKDNPSGDVSVVLGCKTIVK
jgi:von Willebrand factor type A domain